MGCISRFCKRSITTLLMNHQNKTNQVYFSSTVNERIIIAAQISMKKNNRFI